MRARERQLVLAALEELQRVSAIVADCRAGMCPIELDDAPAPLDRAIRALSESVKLGEVRDSSHHDNEARKRRALRGRGAPWTEPTEDP